jgi:hypothetical protein
MNKKTYAEKGCQARMNRCLAKTTIGMKWNHKGNGSGFSQEILLLAGVPIILYPDFFASLSEKQWPGIARAWEA